MGVALGPDEVAYRCNLVTLSDGDPPLMVDFAAGHVSSEQSHPIIAALDSALGAGRDGVRFHAGVEYRHLCVVPREWTDAECTPPHDLTGAAVAWPTGPAAPKLQQLMDASRAVVRDAAAAVDSVATQIWLWGQGATPALPSFAQTYGVEGRLTSAVDLVQGLGVLTGIEIVDVPGATAGFDNDYRAQADACVKSLDDRDFFLVHVEATDEAGHQGLADVKVDALERWDTDIIAPVIGAPRERHTVSRHAPARPRDAVHDSHAHRRAGSLSVLRLRAPRPRRHLLRIGGRGRAGDRCPRAHVPPAREGQPGLNRGPVGPRSSTPFRFPAIAPRGVQSETIPQGLLVSRNTGPGASRPDGTPRSRFSELLLRWSRSRVQPRCRTRRRGAIPGAFPLATRSKLRVRRPRIPSAARGESNEQRDVRARGARRQGSRAAPGHCRGARPQGGQPAEEGRAGRSDPRRHERREQRRERRGAPKPRKIRSTASGKSDLDALAEEEAAIAATSVGEPEVMPVRLPRAASATPAATGTSDRADNGNRQRSSESTESAESSSAESRPDRSPSGNDRQPESQADSQEPRHDDFGGSTPVSSSPTGRPRQPAVGRW